MSDLMSIDEAAARGIERLRQPQWKDPCAHLKLDIINGRPGPWVHLYDPSNSRVNGKDPVSMLFLNVGFDIKEWIEHTGPTCDSEEYKAAQVVFDRWPSK